ncbi:hypothetical protein OROGR_000460 [Orobanche gracilis]
MSEYARTSRRFNRGAAGKETELRPHPGVTRLFRGEERVIRPQPGVGIKKGDGTKKKKIVPNCRMKQLGKDFDSLLISELSEPPNPRLANRVCTICFKHGHWFGICPYLITVPNPRKTTISKDYMIICECCGDRLLDGYDPHPGEAWKGRVLVAPESELSML